MEKGWMLFAVNFSPPLTSNPLSVRALCPLEGSPQPSACPVSYVSYVSYVHLAGRTPPSCKACPTSRVNPHPSSPPPSPSNWHSPPRAHGSPAGGKVGAGWLSTRVDSNPHSLPDSRPAPVQPPCYYRPPAIYPGSRADYGLRDRGRPFVMWIDRSII